MNVVGRRAIGRDAHACGIGSGDPIKRVLVLAEERALAPGRRAHVT